MCVSSRRSRIARLLDIHELQRLVEFLQVVDQQVRPWPVHRLHLTDNSLFKVESALSPPKDFRHHWFSLKRPKDGMANRSLLQIYFAISTARFEGESAA